MPPGKSPSSKRRVGDLVWAVVRGYPNWPGQIMDQNTAPARVHDSRKPGDNILVSFFADASYGWFPDGNLHDFDARYDEFKDQKSSKAAGSKVRSSLCREVLSPAAGLFMTALICAAEFWEGGC